MIRTFFKVGFISSFLLIKIVSRLCSVLYATETKPHCYQNSGMPIGIYVCFLCILFVVLGLRELKILQHLWERERERERERESEILRSASRSPGRCLGPAGGLVVSYAITIRAPYLTPGQIDIFWIISYFSFSKWIIKKWKLPHENWITIMDL